MIVSFASKETETLWLTGKARRLPPDIRKRALAKLQSLHAVKDVYDMAVPFGNRLEKLSGAMAGIWSVRINDQWRLTFRFRGQDAFDVAIIDYH